MRIPLRILSFALASGLVLACSAQKQPAPMATSNAVVHPAPPVPVLGDKPDRPTLVIGIVVDQMRYDYLYRYWNKYPADGLKRLLQEGYSCENTNYNYVPTYTAPGHSAIYTGTTPSHNGIVANDWYDRQSGKSVYCVEDSTVRSVGVDNADEGKMSPRNLLSTTITDQLRLATNFKGKVIGISLKDRASILPAGHVPNAAYWYDGKTGQWITSTYYMNSLPQWVADFNKQKLPEQYLGTAWNTLLPIDQYTESTADNVPYEEPFKGESQPVFPHNLPALRGKEYGLLRETPFGNTLTRQMAEQAITAEGLGKDDITDFLAVSFSATDYVGHRFGPNSIEAEDTYLRLDRDIAHLLAFVDSALGSQNVLIFLTADHGAANNPFYLKDMLHQSVGLFDHKKAIDSLGAYLGQLYGKGQWIEDYTNQQVYLNHTLIGSKKMDLAEVEQKTASFLAAFPALAQVLTGTALSQNNYTQAPASLVQNGYMPARSGDVALVLRPGWMEYRPTGTTHGSPYYYDTHVPLLWYGWKIWPGSSTQPVYIPDIAPTIAALLHIQAPDATTGKPIEGLVR